MTFGEIMWSRLVHTEHGSFAKQKYEANGLSYHNWSHILDTYAYLEAENVPYSQALDLGLLFHDIIYDELPEKELRSAEYMMHYAKWFFDIDVVHDAYELIMATKDHIVKSTSHLWIVKADLNNLRNPYNAVINMGKIMEESRKLYKDKTEKELLIGTRDFMKQFTVRMDENCFSTEDLFFREIQVGIKSVIDVSGLILEKNYGVYL